MVLLIPKIFELFVSGRHSLGAFSIEGQPQVVLIIHLFFPDIQLVISPSFHALVYLLVMDTHSQQMQQFLNLVIVISKKFHISDKYNTYAFPNLCLNRIFQNLASYREMQIDPTQLQHRLVWLNADR